MELNEARHILNENGYLLNEYVVPDKKAMSFFAINADIQDIDDWFYDKEYIEQLKNARKYLTKCSRNIKDASIKNKELDELYTNLNTCSNKLNKIIDNEIKHLEKIMHI